MDKWGMYSEIATTKAVAAVFLHYCSSLVTMALLYAFLIAGCSSRSEPTATALPAPTPTATIVPTQVAAPSSPPATLPPPRLAQQAPVRGTTLPALVARQAAMEAALQQDPPILLRNLLPEDPAATAQQIAVADPEFARYARDSASGLPLRSEIFGVYPWRASDETPATAGCRPDTCYRVEMYNYAYNLTTIGVVDVVQVVLLESAIFPNSQPELPPELTELAFEIAVNAPEVLGTLGDDLVEPVMVNTKTALKYTQCEHSNHLCVAPTFILEDKRLALWAIVDLTDARLVGVNWTHLGTSVGEWPERPTEDQMRKEAVFAQYCTQPTNLVRDGWDLNFIITSSDGLEVFDTTFAGKPVLDSAKLVDWHVQYSETAGFGYNDGIGCPMFSSSAVVAVDGPRIEAIVSAVASASAGVTATVGASAPQTPTSSVGFAVIQDFYHPLWPQPCNYRYQQRYEFYADGSFRVVAINLGRGCGVDGIYRPVLRIDLASTASGGQQVASWDGAAWQPWTAEGWVLQDGSTHYTPEGYQLRIVDAAGHGYSMEPGRGQFDDGGRGDTAFTFVTVARPTEGEADMSTLGSCCGEGYRQGPEQFIEPTPEALAGQDLVIWYVPQQENDDRPGLEYCWADFVWTEGMYVPTGYPCAAGPRFVPVLP